MRVAAVPALGVHVGPAADAQLQLPLARLDFDFRPQWLVLEPARNIHDHPPARQPALAGAVDVGVGDLVHAHVAERIAAPGREAGKQVWVVAVGLVGHALGRAEVNAARHRLTGVGVEHARVHPVAARFRQAEPETRRGLHRALGFQIAESRLAKHLVALRDADVGGRDGANFRIRRTRGEVVRLAPALVDGVHKSLGVLRQRLGIGRRAALDLHIQIEGLLGILGPGQLDPHGTTRRALQWVFVDESGRDAAQHPRQRAAADLHARNCVLGMRVAPRPEEEGPHPSRGHLGNPPLLLVVRPLIARLHAVLAVRRGQIGLAGPHREMA